MVSNWLVTGLVERLGYADKGVAVTPTTRVVAPKPCPNSQLCLTPNQLPKHLPNCPKTPKTLKNTIYIPLSLSLFLSLLGILGIYEASDILLELGREG
jgi:hypothetical protein